MVAEYTAIASQTVAVDSNVLFTAEAVAPSSCKIMHRQGSGIISLRGSARYLVVFNANITGATAGTSIELSLMQNGDPLQTAISTPATADDLNNISIAVVVSVPCGCCATISIENTGTIVTTVQDASIVIEEV